MLLTCLEVMVSLIKALIDRRKTGVKINLKKFSPMDV
jgi:hypothetical protein